MWIALNNAFLSIVDPDPADIPTAERWDSGPDLLMVRARKPEHLAAIFPDYRIYRWPGRDYPCRVFVNRNRLANTIASAVLQVRYGNFKNSVRDDELHDAYSGIWSVMHRYQHGHYQRQTPRFLQADGYQPMEWPELDEDLPCTTPGCSEDQPCLNCITDVLADRHDCGETPGNCACFDEAERYGDFDTGNPADDDSGSTSHLQAPPS